MTAKTLKGAIREHCDPSATISTDGFAHYTGLRKEFAGHWVVDHGAGEYARGNAHRGLVGTFHR